MTAAKPSLDLLRSLTDEHVLRAFLAHGRLTRTEIAGLTGISKPTISESVRRLATAGVLVDTGERTTGRGRAGSYYALAGDRGCALVASIRPGGVQAAAIDPYGRDSARSSIELDRSAGAEAAAAALAEAAAEVAAPGPVRCAVVSVADPVDRATGRVVPLPDAPLLVGELDAAAVLREVTGGPVLVDNDVNWAARAERASGAAAGVDEFAYLHLGEGLGCAVLTDGQVRRGGGGLAGEVAHACVPGPDGRAVPFTEVFAELGLRRPGSAAIDVPALREAAGADADVRGALARAVCGVLSAVITLLDPQLVVLGGAWGPDLAEAVRGELATAPRRTRIATAEVAEPEIAAARAQAAEDLRELIIAEARG